MYQKIVINIPRNSHKEKQKRGIVHLQNWKLWRREKKKFGNVRRSCMITLSHLNVWNFNAVCFFPLTERYTQKIAEFRFDTASIRLLYFYSAMHWGTTRITPWKFIFIFIWDLSLSPSLFSGIFGAFVSLCSPVDEAALLAEKNVSIRE